MLREFLCGGIPVFEIIKFRYLHGTSFLLEGLENNQYNPSTVGEVVVVIISMLHYGIVRYGNYHKSVTF